MRVFTPGHCEIGARQPKSVLHVCASVHRTASRTWCVQLPLPKKKDESPRVPFFFLLKKKKKTAELCQVSDDGALGRNDLLSPKSRQGRVVRDRAYLGKKPKFRGSGLGFANPKPCENASESRMSPAQTTVSNHVGKPDFPC